MNIWTFFFLFLTNANSSETGRELHPKGGRVQAISLNSFKSLPRLNVHSQGKQSMLSLKSNSPAAFLNCLKCLGSLNPQI